jgi:hypothetical protein
MLPGQHLFHQSHDLHHQELHKNLEQEEILVNDRHESPISSLSSLPTTITPTTTTITTNDKTSSTYRQEVWD